MKTINSPKAPQPIGPYSQAIFSNNFLFCSGQIGVDPKTGQLKEGVEKQTRQILENLKTVIEEAKLNLNCVVKTTIFLVNIADFPKVNQIYEEYFSTHKPARSTVAVSQLPKGALIEIEAIVSYEK